MLDARIYLCGRVTVEPDGRVEYQLGIQHAAAGNRAEALRVYANCRKLFREELGAEPSEQTATVFLDILRAQ